MNKQEKIELADFAKELINGFRIHCDIEQHVYRGKKRKVLHKTHKNCYFDLKTTSAGEAIKDGLLIYLGIDEVKNDKKT